MHFLGTGIVTSVPSDAPDDFAALRDLQKKPVCMCICKPISDYIIITLIVGFPEEV